MFIFINGYIFSLIPVILSRYTTLSLKAFPDLPILLLKDLPDTNMPAPLSKEKKRPFRSEIERRKHTEKKLFESEKTLAEFKAYNQAILNTAIDAIIIINETGIVQTFNNAAEKIFGYNADEIIGHNVTLLMPAPYVMEHDDYIDRYLHKGVKKIIGKRLEMVAKHKSGKIFPIDLSVSLVHFGKRRLFTGIIRDITERKRWEAELREHSEALERSNRELEQFAYVASHDLQEPLRMISSYLNLLARRYKQQLDQEANDFIHFAVDGAKRMQHLINDLLAFSRVGTRGKPLLPTDSSDILAKALNNLQLAIEDNKAKVTADELPAVMADEIQLTQLFQNLVGNAIKFHGSANPEIHISAQRRRKFWEFAVQDNGIGIDPSFQEKIFQIFQRLHTRDQYPGTGIGLAICKKIVERHGGRIWVKSVQNAGSIFYFTLPALDNKEIRHEQHTS